MDGLRATLTSARRRPGGRGIQFTHCPAVQQSRTPTWAELGRIKEEAVRSSPQQSRRKVAGLRLIGSPSTSLRPDPSAPGSPTVEIPAPVRLWQLLKVRLIVCLHAESAKGVVKSRERPTHPSFLARLPGSADLGRRGPLAGNFVRCCRQLPVLAGAAAARRRLGLRFLQQTVEKLPRKDPGGRRGGRCCYFLAPAPRLGEEGCGGEACSQPTASSAPNTVELVCGVEV